MSLEDTIKENTQAVRELIAALKAQGNTPCQVPPEDKAPPVKEESKEEEPKEERSYAYIQKPFLKLVHKNREAALALLRELGVPEGKKLDVFENKPEEFDRILALIEEKLNG